MTARFCFVALAVCACLSGQVDPRGRSVLFIRGADGTGGLGTGTFEQRTRHLSDVTDQSQAAGNTGYGELRALLLADGFQVAQLVESAQPLTTAALLPHRVVVFGSNNKVYAAAEVQAFHAYVDAGGSALFMSDANWGATWETAAASDNQFLDRYGAQVWQDNAEFNSVTRAQPGRYVQPDHPVLSGPDRAGGAFDVNAFDGALARRLLAGRPDRRPALCGSDLVCLATALTGMLFALQATLALVTDSSTQWHGIVYIEFDKIGTAREWAEPLAGLVVGALLVLGARPLSRHAWRDQRQSAA